MEKAQEESNPGIAIRHYQAIIDKKKSERDELKESPQIALKKLTLRLVEQGDYEKALTFLEAAVKIDPDIFLETEIHPVKEINDHWQKLQESFQQHGAKIVLENSSSVQQGNTMSPPNDSPNMNK